MLDENSLQIFDITLAIGKIDNNNIKPPYAAICALPPSEDNEDARSVKEKTTKIKNT